jgi:hypothetical protein
MSFPARDLPAQYQQALQMQKAARRRHFVKGKKADLGHFHGSCRVGLVVSHPFHKEREMDGAQSILTLSEKML